LEVARTVLWAGIARRQIDLIREALRMGRSAPNFARPTCSGGSCAARSTRFKYTLGHKSQASGNRPAPRHQVIRGGVLSECRVGCL